MFTLAFVALLQLATPAPQNAPVPAVEQLADAEARYRSAIALNPSIAAYHESLALVLERRGAMADALAEHERAVSLDSSSARNRSGLGQLLLRLGRRNEALIHLRAALAADSQSVPASVTASLAELGGTTATQGYHDLSGFVDDERSTHSLRVAVERLFAAVLGLSALVLLAPIVSALLALLLEMPRQWLARHHA